MSNKIVLLIVFNLIISCKHTVRTNDERYPDNFDEIKVEINKIVERKGLDTLLDFKKIGLFDTMYVFGPFVSLIEIEDIFRNSFNFRNERSKSVTDNECLIVFKGNELDRKYFFLSRSTDISIYSRKQFEYNNSIILLPKKN